MRARRARRESLVPADWQDQVLSLPDDGSGRAFSFNRLQAIVADGALFLELWEREAKRLNWSSLNLFGVHPMAPAIRFDVVGLVPILNGATVRLLTPGSAIIAAPTGSALTYTKGPQGGAVPLWELLP
jgi:hypothetical protein